MLLLDVTCKCRSQSPRKPSTSLKPAWLNIMFFNTNEEKILHEVSVFKLIYNLCLIGKNLIVVLQGHFKLKLQRMRPEYQSPTSCLQGKIYLRSHSFKSPSTACIRLDISQCSARTLNVQQMWPEPVRCQSPARRLQSKLCYSSVNIGIFSVQASPQLVSLIQCVYLLYVIERVLQVLKPDSQDA